MKISPFEKASVSNIKDIFLTLISINYFKDVNLTFVSETGIALCLIASLAFSITLISKDNPKAIEGEDR